MERDFFSQPLNKNRGYHSKTMYHSQPTLPQEMEHDESLIDISHTDNNASNSSSDQCNMETSCVPRMSQSSTNICKLFDDYKCVSDELSTSLQEFRSEKIALENELEQLNQENEYLKLELDRQQSQIGNLCQTSKCLSDKLTKDESEIKRIVELKLLEIQEIFSSIDSADKFINDFKSKFSNSISEAKAFSENIKTNLVELKKNISEESSEYSDSCKKIVFDCSNELDKIKSKILELEKKIEDGLNTLKIKTIEEVHFNEELNNLLKEIDDEQKRKKELEDSLLHYCNSITVSKEEHLTRKKKFDNEMKELSSCYSELNLSKSKLNSDISSSECDLSNLKVEHDKLKCRLDSLQAVLIKKRHEDESIQQEIEALQKQAGVLKEDCNVSLNEIDSKSAVELELKDLETEISLIMEKCNDLERTRDCCLSENPLDSLAAHEKEQERTMILYSELKNNVEVLQNDLVEKETACNAAKLEQNNMRTTLNEKLDYFETVSNNTEELDCLRKRNEELSLEASKIEKDVKLRKEVVHQLEKVLIRQREVYGKYEVEFEDKLNGYERSDCDDELFEVYNETLNALNDLEVTDMDDRIKRVAASVEFNMKQTEELMETCKFECDKLRDQYGKQIMQMNNELEEHRKYCEDAIVKLDSKMQCDQRKNTSIQDYINLKRAEISSQLPKLTKAVLTGLQLFGKIVEYYAHASAQKHDPGISTIHWDNAEEVLKEILLLPLHNISKLRGMPCIDTVAATPRIYSTVLEHANKIFSTILKERDAKPVDYTCKRLIEMRNALYNHSDGSDSPISKTLNDTFYSTSNED